jgi:hypothetical protein
VRWGYREIEIDTGSDVDAGSYLWHRVDCYMVRRLAHHYFLSLLDVDIDVDVDAGATVLSPRLALCLHDFYYHDC